MGYHDIWLIKILNRRFLNSTPKYSFMSFFGWCCNVWNDPLLARLIIVLSLWHWDRLALWWDNTEMPAMISFKCFNNSQFGNIMRSERFSPSGEENIWNISPLPRSASYLSISVWRWQLCDCWSLVALYGNMGYTCAAPNHVDENIFYFKNILPAHYSNIFSNEIWRLASEVVW